MAEVLRVTGRFLAQHAHMITQDIIDRSKERDTNQSIQYAPGNILLLNNNEQMIVPYNMIDGHVKEGAWVNQAYQFVLETPVGSEEKHLQPTKGETLDTTVLQLIDLGKDSFAAFVPEDYDLFGKGNYYGTFLSVGTNIQSSHAAVMRDKLYEGKIGRLFNIESMGVYTGSQKDDSK